VLLVVSVDIDGTLEGGDPPGPVAIDTVRAVAGAGHVVGSASDRPRADQGAVWARHGVDVAFTRGKHHLPGVRQRFAAARYLHIGDTDIDEHFARLARFEFLHCEDVPGLLAVGPSWFGGPAAAW
jgi:hypothetical protein